MSARSRVGTWWRAVFDRDAVAAQVREELEFHVESRAAELMGEGVTREEAVRRARAELGSAAAASENARQAWGTRWLDELDGDLRYALRRLRRSPGFAAVAVGSLALGIGANTAIFSLTKALLLDAMPVEHPEQLRLLEWQVLHQFSYRNLPMQSLHGDVTFTKTGVTTGTEFSYAAYAALRQNRTVFEDLMAYFHDRHVAIGVGNEVQPGTVEYVSGSFFPVLGVRAAMGRTLLPQDGGRKPAAVVVISDWLWRDVYGRKPEAIGAVLRLNGVAATVVGVAPAGFHGAGVDIDPALYLPLNMQALVSPARWEQGRSRLDDPDTWWLRVMGRMRPGVTDAQAQAALDGVFRQTEKAGLKHADRVDGESLHLVVAPGGRADAEGTQGFAPVAMGLSALAGLVLVLACLNLANLLLARAVARRKELSVRLALGAGRARVGRQLLTESLTLAVLGGAAGTALGFAGRNLIPHFLEDQRPVWDWKVFGFALALTVATGMLFGGIPAWRAAHEKVQAGPGESGRATADRRRSGLNRVLVAAQIGLSMVLLMGAGLFAQTVRRLLEVRPGFETRGILLFEADLPDSRYQTPVARVAALMQMEGRLRALPGVESATLSGEPMISGGPSTTNFDVTGEPAGRTTAWMNVVGDDFFGTMGIPLLAGRDFGPDDAAASARVAIVNEALARKFFPGKNPIGETFNTSRVRIVGVAGNAKFADLRQEPPPTYYVPERQNGEWNPVTFEVRTAGDPLALAGAARSAVHAVDAQLPLLHIRTQEEQIEDSIRDERLFAVLTAGFGGLALVLACVGIYGMMAYQVAQRTSEIGVRMALGAEPGRVLRMVVGEAWWMAAAGIAAGLGAALALGRLVASELYGVRPGDPATLGGAAAVLLAVAVAASWIPAQRAAGVDPMEALRHE